jgi:hypothetical protein
VANKVTQTNLPVYAFGMLPFKGGMQGGASATLPAREEDDDEKVRLRPLVVHVACHDKYI